MKKHTYLRKKVSTKKKGRKPKKSSMMQTFRIYYRKNRLAARKHLSAFTVTHFNIEAAREIAAAKHPNLWVSLEPINSK